MMGLNEDGTPCLARSYPPAHIARRGGHCVTSRQPPLPVTSFPTASSHSPYSQLVQFKLVSAPSHALEVHGLTRMDPKINLQWKEAGYSSMLGRVGDFGLASGPPAPLSLRAATSQIPEMTQFITTLTPPNYRRKQFQLIKALISSLGFRPPTFPDSTHRLGGALLQTSRCSFYFCSH